MNKFARCLFLIGVLLLPVMSFAQHSNLLAPGYYVVVAAYAPSREDAAKTYAEELKSKGHNSSYGFNATWKRYFVYLKYFDDLRKSLVDMKQTRIQGDFPDAWVSVVAGDIGQLASPVTVTPDSQKPSQPSPAETVPPVQSGQAPVTPQTESPVEGPVIEDNPEIVQYKVMTLGNTEVFLSLYNARNNRIVDGKVDVIDTDRARLMTTVKGNEYLVLPDPKSKSGELTLLCESFGYRKVQQQINYPLPLADTVKSYIDLMGTTLVVNFDLVRYHKGDIATLFNVYFFNDAALMLPESKYELNNLLQLMNENPNYNIRLHGHSNGNYSGKILTFGEDKNFFSLEGAKQGMGSAKDLSRERAEVIRQFLIANGIAETRMDIKAWGGRRPLYDKNSVNAKKNVRVDVEILQE